MASQQPPEPPPPAEPAPITLTALGDDLLREIFLRLPSLPSLVRAAFACRTFLDVIRSSPAFRRSFRALPLLGIYFDPDGAGIPAFSRPLRRRSDPDLRAAVRRADFFLTGLPDDDDDFPGWTINDCHDGYLILDNSTTRQLVAYNPLTMSLDLILPPPEEFYDGWHGYINCLELHILSLEEDDGVFRVIYACHDESRARPAVFSSDTKAWQVFPWSEALKTPQPADDKYWLTTGRIINGFVYWYFLDEPFMLLLNTTTLHFSRMDLPYYLVGQTQYQSHTYTSFSVGKIKDGGLCVVVAFGFELDVWLREICDDGVEKWVQHQLVLLDDIVKETGGTLEEHGVLMVLGIVDGFVYLSTDETLENKHLPVWFLCVDLETLDLDLLFQKKKRDDSPIHPYIMPWPRSLVRDKPCLQVEGA